MHLAIRMGGNGRMVDRAARELVSWLRAPLVTTVWSLLHAQGSQRI